MRERAIRFVNSNPEMRRIMESWVLFPCNVAGTVRKSEVAYLDYSDLGAARQPAASGGSAAPTTSGGSGGGVS